LKFVLGIDVGTHGVRILAYDLDSKKVVKRIKRDYFRENISHGHQEMDALDLKSTFFQCIHDLDFTEKDKVLALGITHQRGTIIPIDKELKPLAAAICDSDERAIAADEIEKYGITENEYYNITGCPLVSFNGMSKILWFMENERELFDSAYSWLSPQDYLISTLLNEVTTTHGSILRNGYYNIAERKAADNIFGQKTPNFIRLKSRGLGEKLGIIKPWNDMPRWLEGAYVVSVPGDQPCGLIGSGAANKGDIAMNLGTTFVLSLLSEKYFLGNKKITNEILPGGYYAPEFGSGAGGQFMDWVARLLYGTTDLDSGWQELDDIAQTIPPGSHDLHIIPLLWQVTSPNIQGGIKRISSIHTKAHIVRAAYEGLAYEAKISLETIEEAGNTSDIRVYGGMSRLSGFLQILSSVTNKKIIVSKEGEASALGAALVSAVAVHSFDNIIEASKSRQDKVANIIRPNAMEVDYYERGFKKYKGERA